MLLFYWTKRKVYKINSTMFFFEPFPYILFAKIASIPISPPPWKTSGPTLRSSMNFIHPWGAQTLHQLKHVPMYLWFHFKEKVSQWATPPLWACLILLSDLPVTAVEAQNCLLNFVQAPSIIMIRLISICLRTRHQTIPGTIRPSCSSTPILSIV